MYYPGLGRFSTRDPIEYDAGDANRYRYVRNNPLNATAPNQFQLTAALLQSTNRDEGSQSSASEDYHHGPFSGKIRAWVEQPKGGPRGTEDLFPHRKWGIYVSSTEMVDKGSPEDATLRCHWLQFLMVRVWAYTRIASGPEIGKLHGRTLDITFHPRTQDVRSSTGAPIWHLDNDPSTGSPWYDDIKDAAVRDVRGSAIHIFDNPNTFSAPKVFKTLMPSLDRIPGIERVDVLAFYETYLVCDGQALALVKWNRKVSFDASGWDSPRQRLKIMEGHSQVPSPFGQPSIELLPQVYFAQKELVNKKYPGSLK